AHTRGTAADGEHVRAILRGAADRIRNLHADRRRGAVRSARAADGRPEPSRDADILDRARERGDAPTREARARGSQKKIEIPEAGPTEPIVLSPAPVAQSPSF